ncbi:hypothetical protein IWX90DRAFT_96523 [Phyllosticta citrichinensis]|uniref:Secreted protein n=1 Tax=Phyllosticta citrichinensis TaxID=1130410 RepID=A0ABR1XEP3_9PEZI
MLLFFLRYPLLAFGFLGRQGSPCLSNASKQSNPSRQQPRGKSRPRNRCIRWQLAWSPFLSLLATGTIFEQIYIQQLQPTHRHSRAFSPHIIIALRRYFREVVVLLAANFKTLKPLAVGHRRLPLISHITHDRGPGTRANNKHSSCRRWLLYSANHNRLESHRVC